VLIVSYLRLALGGLLSTTSLSVWWQVTAVSRD